MMQESNLGNNMAQFTISRRSKRIAISFTPEMQKHYHGISQVCKDKDGNIEKFAACVHRLLEMMMQEERRDSSASI